MSLDQRAEEARRRRLIEGALPLVEQIARKVAAFAGAQWFEDLVGEGRLGAVQAAAAYDLASDVPFAGFAWSRISGAMIDYLRRQRLRLPQGTAAALEKAAACLRTAGGYAAAAADKGEDFLEDEVSGMATSEALGLLGSGQPPLDPEAGLGAKERERQVQRGIAQLRERDRIVIQLRDYEDQSFKEIGERFGIEENAAGKRYHDAVRRLGAVVRPILLES